MPVSWPAGQPAAVPPVPVSRRTATRSPRRRPGLSTGTQGRALPRFMSAVRVLCHRLREIGSHISGLRGHSYEEHVLATAEEQVCTRPKGGSPRPSSSSVGRIRPARRRRTSRTQGLRPRGWASGRRRMDTVWLEDHGTGVDGLYAIGEVLSGPHSRPCAAGQPGVVRSRANGTEGRTARSSTTRGAHA